MTTSGPIAATRKPMDSRELDHNIERLLELPLREQAICVWLAAEPVVKHWREYCRRNELPDHTDTYVECFQNWCSGTATDDELNAITLQLEVDLPGDLRRDEDPIGGMAGWSLRDVAAIALDQCEEVHEDILATAVAYAAAAATNNRKVPVEIDWERLSEAEMQYLEQWWRRCLEQRSQKGNECD